MYRLMFGDCLDRLTEVADDSVDLVLSDLPYGSTKMGWDRVIDPARLWSAYRRVLRPSGAVVLTADLRFAMTMIAAAPRGWYRYDLVWDKVASVGFLDARRRPLRRHELILVFAPRRPSYRPQMGQGEPYGLRGSRVVCQSYGRQRPSEVPRICNRGSRFPTSILRFSNANGKHRGKRHPTVKPLDLMDYLIRTYSDEGQVVLDNAMGSGRTGQAALSAGRQFLGIESDPGFFELAAAAIGRWAPGPAGGTARPPGRSWAQASIPPADDAGASLPPPTAAAGVACVPDGTWRRVE